MVRSVLVFLVFSVLTNVYGQHYTLRHYSAQDGLPQSQVNVMLEDKNGYLWIGTQGGGLARFDGREFKIYTTLDGLLSNMVTFLKLDRDSTLWVAHPRGISKFDGVSFKKFQQPEGEKLKRVRRLSEVGDTLFMLTAQGQVGKVYKDSLYFWAKEIVPGKRVHYMHTLPNKDILFYLSDSSFLVKGKMNFAFSHRTKFNVLKNMFNYEGDVVLKTDSGYFQINLEKRDFSRIEVPLKNNYISYDSVRDVFWSRTNDLLLREARVKGASRIDTILHDNEISQVFIDSEMNTWIGTIGSGLYKYYIQDFDRCSSENMKFVMAITKDSEGSSWIGSQSTGLWRVKGNNFFHFIDKKDTYRNVVHCISEGPGKKMYVGTSGGLGLITLGDEQVQWFSRNDGLSSNVISALQFDEYGGVWLATYGGGLNYFNGEKFSSISTEQGLTSNLITALHYSKKYKKLFYGSEYGIGVVKDGEVSSILIQGAENTSILSINPYQDSLLLVGTSGAGIAILNPGTNNNRLLTVYDGLPSGFIYFVAADPSGYIWVGTEKGISRLKLDEKFEILKNIHYGFENGLQGVETNQNAFYLAGKEKYFGLIDGLYQFNEVNGEKNARTFDLHLTSVDLLYGEFDARNFSKVNFGFFRIPVRPEFDADKNHVTFRFNRVNKQYPKSVRYKYFLDNYDKKWSLPSANNYVTYSNLPPGEYTFRAVATDANGGWGGNVLVYSFSIRAPFYQSPVFIMIAIMIFVGIIILVAYLRVRQRIEKALMLERIRVREQESLRKEVARDFHDEMGNQLTRIINYISLLRINGNGNGHGASHLDDLYTKVENSAKYLYTGTRDFIWSIDPVNDELSKLFIHIRDFGEKLFEEKGIQFRANNGVKEKIRLPYGFSREVNLIFKEAMTNTFKYSGASNTTLSLQRMGAGYEIYFEDDGTGFNIANIQKLNGLKNIRERADKIKAVLRIHSKEGEGTRISLSFKFTKTPQYGITV